MSILTQDHDLDTLRRQASVMHLSVLGVRVGALKKIASLMLMNASIRLSFDAYDRDLRLIPSPVTIDADDVLSERLAGMIEQVSDSIAVSASAQGERRGVWRGMMLFLVVRQLKALRRKIERVRMFIIEHDADASERSQVFEDAESLIRHLRRA